MLPVEASIADLRAALDEHGVAVLTAPPGAGKTTVVPLRLLDGIDRIDGGGRIVMLEPRRIATRAAARRMAATLGERVGDTVGYRTRDERRVSERTRVEVITDGILTRRLHHDRTLAGVAIVVFDEFHERNLQADLGLALTLDVRRTVRPDLRVLVMSATLDAARVARLLGDGTPVVHAEGRQHPVDVRWLPTPTQQRLDDAAVAAVERALRDDDGDLLVFLPGAADIRRVEQRLSATAAAGVDVLPLHGSLPAEQQDRALEPAPVGRRKVVLSTDIAETSLTVEGVRVVIDAGLTRVPRLDTRTAMTRLQTVPASKASTDQRAGRAGRTQPGVAYRLWSKLEHAARRPHVDPEIGQVDLAAFALELAAWGTTDPAALPLLDQPPRRALDDARALLRDLGAVDDAGAITGAGRRMVALPLHPRLAHMVVSATSDDDAWLACVVAALLEERDILRGHPDEKPADLRVRVAMVRHDDRRATDIATRAGVAPATDVAVARTGAVLRAAYPDRVARNRNERTPGRFRLPSGVTAWVRADDSLAHEPLLVVAELDGHRRDPRILLAAPVDAD